MKDIKENELELEYGMLLRAKKRLRTCDRSFNSPSTTYVEKDTVVIIANEGTSRGDVGCKAIGLFNEHNVFTPLPNLSDDFFREGHRTRCPYDKGIVDLKCWELVGHLKGDEFLFFQRQAPHSTNMPLVVINENDTFEFSVGTWDGWSIVPPCFIAGVYSSMPSFLRQHTKLQTIDYQGSHDTETIQNVLDGFQKDAYLVASLRNITVKARLDLCKHMGLDYNRLDENEDILVFRQDDLITLERWFQRLPFE